MAIQTTYLTLTDFISTGDTAVFFDASGKTQPSEIENYTTEDFNLVEQFISTTALDTSGISLSLWNLNSGTTSTGSTLLRVGTIGQRAVDATYAYECYVDNYWARYPIAKEDYTTEDFNLTELYLTDAYVINMLQSGTNWQGDIWSGTTLTGITDGQRYVDSNYVYEIYSTPLRLGISKLAIKNDVTILATGETIAFVTGYAGWGFIMAGDNEAYASFCFDSGYTNIIFNYSTTNMAGIDTGGKMCLYNSGGTLALKNNLSDSKTIKYNLNY